LKKNCFDHTTSLRFSGKQHVSANEIMRKNKNKLRACHSRKTTVARTKRLTVFPSDFIVAPLPVSTPTQKKHLKLTVPCPTIYSQREYCLRPNLHIFWRAHITKRLLYTWIACCSLSYCTLKLAYIEH